MQCRTWQLQGGRRGLRVPPLSFSDPQKARLRRTVWEPQETCWGGQKTAEKGRHGQRRCVRLRGRGGKGDEGVRNWGLQRELELLAGLKNDGGPQVAPGKICGWRGP